jgi:DNA-binding beta-propeller fold protein YncE
MRRMRAIMVLALCGCTTVVFPPGSQVPPHETPSWAHQDRFAITDNRSDLLSFVTADAAQPALLGNMPVGDIPVELEGPHHLAVSPDGKWIYYNLSNYVPGTGSGPHGSHGLGLVPGSLVKIDAATTQKLAEVLIDRSPGDVVLSTDGATAFITHYDLLKVQAGQMSGKTEDAYSSLAVVDTATMTRIAMIPLCVTAHGEGLSPDGKTLYATCALTDQLAVVDVHDPAHPTVTARVPVGPNPNISLGMNGIYGPYALTVARDGTVWVSNNNSGDVRVYDPATAQMDPARVFAVGGVAMFGDFSADGAKYFVPHQGDDQVTIIDVASKAMTTLPLPSGSCKNAHMLHLTPDGARAILVCEGDHVTMPGTAVFLSITPTVVTGFVEVGLFPDGAAWLPPAP